MSLYLEFKDRLKEHRLSDSGNHILIAVSGGADSVALLRLFNAVKDEMQLTLTAFHLNHQLRGQDAADDQHFVEILCTQMNIPCYSYSEDIAAFASEKSISFETAARERRYALMDQVFVEQGCDRIALAHHLNDQVETFFQRLTRGSGIDGLTGMEWIREGRYIRPLLKTTRSEIETFLDSLKQPFCIDETNSDVNYMRNRVRHELIPYLERHFNGNAVNRIGHTMELLKLDKDFLEAETEKFFSQAVKSKGEGFVISLKSLEAIHQAILQRTIRLLFLKAKGSLQGFEASHLDEILNLAGNKRHGARKCYQGICFEIQYGNLTVTRADFPPKPKGYTYELSANAPLIIREAGLVLTLTCYDHKNDLEDIGPNRYLIAGDRLKLPLTVRNRIPGDQIQKKGLQGHKAVKDIFREQRLSQNDRERLPVIVDGDEVIWVPFGILAETYYVTAQTAVVYVLSVEKL